MKVMNKKMKKRKGFTLVELVVVIAILGILAAIAVPKLSESRTNAANSAHNANVRTLESAATMLVVEKGVPASTVNWDETVATQNNAGTGWGPYLQKWPKVPTGRKDGSANDKYTVEIVKDTGEIKVEPKAIDLD